MNMLDDWQRVKAAFEQALAVDETDRSAFPVAVCESDALLRQRIDALLASQAASASFLETSASAVLELPRPCADLSGQTLGTYRLLSRIGAGAMGEVYAAHDEKLNRCVAVKLIAKDLARDVDRLQRLRQEAHAASSLNHPNIVVVHDFGEMDVRPFIVTELVEGVTLRARLEDGPLPLPEAIEIALQVTSGLAAAHAPGLVHCDIKPENEQARAESVDAGTDVFSVGAVLYEMVTGRPAFGGESHAVIFAATLGQTPPAPTALTPQVPPELERLITKALEKDRALRYQGVADMRADLLHLRRESDARHLAASKYPEQRPIRTGERARHVGRRAWVAVALVILVSGLVVEQSRRTIDLEPAAGLPYALFALAHADLGKRAEAVRAAGTAVRLSNGPIPQ